MSEFRNTKSVVVFIVQNELMEVEKVFTFSGDSTSEEIVNFYNKLRSNHPNHTTSFVCRDIECFKE